MIAYIAGIMLIAYSPVLPGIELCGMAVAIMFIRQLFLSCKLFVLGLLVASLWGHWQLEHRANFTSTVEVIVSGEVIGLVEALPKRQRFVLKLRSMDVLANEEPVAKQLRRLRTLRLSWYRGDQVISTGSTVTAVVRIKSPHGSQNPFGFDFERWLLERSIDAVGTIKQIKDIQFSKTTSTDSVRGDIAEFINQQAISGQSKVTLQALLLGLKSDLNDDQWKILRSTGTVHLLVISGMHIGFLAALCFLLFKYLLPIVLPSAQDHRPLIYLITIGCCYGYTSIAGYGLSAQRALIMLTCYLLPGLFLRSFSCWQRWWFAIAAVLTFQPLAIFSAGFWLSFLAVAVLLTQLGLKSSGSRMWILWVCQLNLLILLAPVLLYLFGEVSVIAPLINIIVIPLVAIVLCLAPIALVLAGWGWQYPISKLSLIIDSFWQGLKFAAELPVSSIEVTVSSGVVISALVVGGLVLIAPKIGGYRWLGVVFWLPVLVSMKSENEYPLDIWIFDVNQGLSVFVQADNKTLLYDTGAAYGSGSSFRSKVAPALERWQIETLDLFVISHADNDHAGGRKHVTADLAVKQRFTGSKKLVKREGYTACIPGQRWQWGDVQISVLYGSRGRKENERSCVMRIETRQCSLLLTGDISYVEEHRINTKPVTWLVASHHGSRFGTSEPWLERTKPQLVLFSAGFANPFKHPHPSVINRIRRYGIPFLNTAEDGAIHLYQTESGECKVETMRAARPHYWL